MIIGSDTKSTTHLYVHVTVCSPLSGPKFVLSMINTQEDEFVHVGVTSPPTAIKPRLLSLRE